MTTHFTWTIALPIDHEDPSFLELLSPSSLILGVLASDEVDDTETAEAALSILLDLDSNFLSPSNFFTLVRSALTSA